MTENTQAWQVNGEPKTIVDLLSRLVRCASVTPSSDGVLDVVEAALVPLGFACTRLTFTGDGSYPVENLFATRKGSLPGPHLLFGGHTDVVPPGDEAAWTHPPFGAEIVGDTMYGRGTVDMKSGIAAFCGALARLAGEGRLEAGTVSLAITNDEEADAVNGTAKLMEWAAAQGHRFDFAIVGEPGSKETVGDSIKIGRRGSLTGRVTVEGVQGHVAYPERAANPMPVLAAIATALDAPLDDGSAHFQPSNLEVVSIDTGNPVSNVIPARGTLLFNVRFNDGWTGETLRAEIERRIAAVPHGQCRSRFEVTGPISRAFLCPAEDAQPLVAAIEAETGRAPELSTGGGTSDARFIAHYCPVVELGLVGRGLHQVDEQVPLADLERLTALYARVIAHILGGRP